ncbi:hypothetical protein [Nocardia wallacei]|uniref:Uncharacterized protein n=3 Tax=Nocardia wallacei TaxID=480035 RepID=A0A7G1KJ03_9NOCA|nr:hypothetical protein [Nocardia wallacei]BCK55227.1 hypothetical protein NWFMUON74_29990 [Nocardia wallacei]
MPVLPARIIAVPVSLWLLVALAFDADYRADNIFALPDAAFSLVLLISAALPARLAVPGLTAGFFFGSGVVTVAAVDRFARAEPAQAILDLVVAAIYLGVAAGLVTRAPARASA